MTTKTRTTKTTSHAARKTGNGKGAAEKAVVRALLDRQDRTYAAEAGIRLRNTPGPLYQVLVLAVLLSARIPADIAVAAARALFEAGMRDARSMPAGARPLTRRPGRNRPGPASNRLARLWTGRPRPNGRPR